MHGNPNPAFPPWRAAAAAHVRRGAAVSHCLTLISCSEPPATTRLNVRARAWWFLHFEGARPAPLGKAARPLKPGTGLEYLLIYLSFRPSATRTSWWMSLWTGCALGKLPRHIPECSGQEREPLRAISGFPSAPLAERVLKARQYICHAAAEWWHSSNVSACLL